MKKRILSSLLTFVLFLSIAPISALGANNFTTMTLVQKTTGEFSDLDKEFVYYIAVLHFYTDMTTPGEFAYDVKIDTEAYPNVEIIEDNIMMCNHAEIWARESNTNERTALSNHTLMTRHNYTYWPCQFYKITLKNGQSVEMKVRTTKPISYE